MNQELILLKTQDKKQIALWKITTPKSDPSKNIFLTHGTYSDKRICLGISSFLVEHGFICWILEWRNHGQSPKTKHKFNFESIAKHDLLAAIDYLCKTLTVKDLHCITHSGGGICLTIFLIKNPEYIDKVNTISMFGCQAFGAANNFKNYTRILLGKYVGKMMGYFPGTKAGSPEDESYFFMKQWLDWNLSKKFIGENNVNYVQQMRNIKIPILSISGIGDTFIAPSSGCKNYLDAFQNPQNKFLLCGLKNGNLEDYNHSRILQSKNSRKEIWPQVLEWIEDKRN